MAQHASPLEIDVDDRDMLAKFAQFNLRSAEIIRQMILRAMQLVGLTAIERYMVKAKLLDYKTGFTIGAKGDKLNIRMGRLSRSLIDGFAFGTGLGGVQESIRKIIVTGRIFEGLFGTSVPYAAIHEYGGETHPSITDKSRRFFWAMYANTQLPMWRAMALSKKDNFNIKIPARPYLHPALKDSDPQIQLMFAGAMNKLSKEVSDE